MDKLKVGVVGLGLGRHHVAAYAEGLITDARKRDTIAFSIAMFIFSHRGTQFSSICQLIVHTRKEKASK